METERETKFQSLCDKAKKLPERALARIQNGKAVFSAVVFIPHHEFARPFAFLIRDAFTEFGFGIDVVTHNKVSGQEFVIHIRSLSPIGLSLITTYHAVYLPTVDGLLPHQVSNLRKVAEEMNEHYRVRNEMEPGSMLVEVY